MTIAHKEGAYVEGKAAHDSLIPRKTPVLLTGLPCEQPAVFLTPHFLTRRALHGAENVSFLWYALIRTVYF
jgi:hypothetical protein